jgi:hypothetical protein
MYLTNKNQIFFCIIFKMILNLISVSWTVSQEKSLRVTAETAFTQLAEPREADGLETAILYSIHDFI